MIEHTFHQSDFNTFFKCPEQLRLKLAGELPRRTSDAAYVGTAMHDAIEVVLRGGSRTDGHDRIAERWLNPPDDLEMVQVKNLATAQAQSHRCFDAWVEHVHPQLTVPVWIEERFKVLLHEDDERTIWLGGTVDYVDEVLGLWDWKTAGRAYEGWEVDRFHIQPTVYSYAWATITLDYEPHDWTYAVMVKGSQPKVQFVRTQRHGGHWTWLRKQAIAMARLIEADLPQWPLHDQGWWCSAKWCPVWSQCKGAHV